MNKNDSERIAGLLAGLGFQSTDEEQAADLILFNTCSVRQSAEDRLFGKMEDMLRLKETNPDLIVAVTGCMPGRDAKRVQTTDSVSWGRPRSSSSWRYSF
jgi:tRNA-2-methylthio-N6-dimethylallyladenosine synthase